MRVSRRLCEAIIEAAAARSRHVRENSIERDSSFLVRIETLIEKIAKKAAVLRNAFAIDARGRSDGVTAVLRIGGKIAHGCEAEAGNYGIGDDVNVFVNFPRLEAPVQMNVPIARCQLTVYRVRELPVGAANHSTLGIA